MAEDAAEDSAGPGFAGPKHDLQLHRIHAGLELLS